MSIDTAGKNTFIGKIAKLVVHICYNRKDIVRKIWETLKA